MNYIKIFQTTKTLSDSVGKSFTENHLMYIFLDNFHQGGEYTAQIVSHQAELRGNERFTDIKDLSISSLHPDYLNLDRISDINN